MAEVVTRSQLFFVGYEGDEDTLLALEKLSKAGRAYAEWCAFEFTDFEVVHRYSLWIFSG